MCVGTVGGARSPAGTSYYWGEGWMVMDGDGATCVCGLRVHSVLYVHLPSFPKSGASKRRVE